MYSSRLVITGVLLALGLLLYLPGMQKMPILDRDSAHFSQASKQMYLSGDYWKIKFHHQLRQRKPPLFYWLQVSSLELFHDNLLKPFTYRLPSLVASLLSVCLLYFLLMPLIGQRSSLAGAIMTGTSFLFIFETHLTTTDASLLCAIIAMQCALLIIYQQHREGYTSKFYPVIFWLGLGVGFLIKGTAPLIALLTIVPLCFLDKDAAFLKRLNLYLGLFTTASLIFIMTRFSQHTGKAFFWDMFTHDFLPKLLHGQESHGALPGYYTLLFALLAWPGSLWLWQVLNMCYQRFSDPIIRFCSIWFGANFLIIELIPTKLPQYMLPIIPAFAILLGIMLSRPSPILTPKLMRWHKIYWLSINNLAALAIAFAPYYFMRQLFWVSITLSLSLVLLNVYLYRHGDNTSFYKLLLLVCLGAAINSFNLFSQVLPNLSPFWISDKIARHIPQHASITSIGYYEPSLVFLLGENRVDFMQRKALGHRPITNNYVLVDQKYSGQTSVLKNLRSFHKVASINGFLYNKGKWKSYSLYKNKSCAQ